MKLINKPRGTGKSTLLIEMAHMFDVPIVATSYAHKKHLEQLAERMGYNVEIYDWMEWKTIPHSPDTKILVDECEALIKAALEEMLGSEIVAGTLTLPMEEDNNVATI